MYYVSRVRRGPSVGGTTLALLVMNAPGSILGLFLWGTGVNISLGFCRGAGREMQSDVRSEGPEPRYLPYRGLSVGRYLGKGDLALLGHPSLT